MFREQGRRKAVLAALVSAALIAGATWGVAADKPESKPTAGMHGGQGMGAMGGMQGMQGMGGMMGMMDMMHSGNRMMHGGSTVHGLPQLPPGNAKLQLQMHAEMMQKMGEILAKYAAQIKEDKR